MASEPFVAGQSALWVQVEGPNTEPSYLGCHQLEDIDEPKGDVELIFCPDPSGQNRFEVRGSFQGAPGAVTTSIITDVNEVCDYLELVEGQVPIFINKAKSGRRDVFGNYIRQFILINARVTNITLSNLAARTPDDQARSEQTFELSAESVLRIFRPSMSRQVIAFTEDLHGVTFCDDRCRTGFVGGDALYSANAVVYKTIDAGATWEAASADPFDTDEDIRGMTCFELGLDVNRIIVGRGTTDAGNPLGIAYTDDNGDTWVQVDVGSTNGQFVPTANAVFSLDWTHIWVGSSGGYIYFSGNGGATWQAQTSGALTVQAINAVHFADADNGWAGGGANAILKTTTGGTTWEVVSGPLAEAGNAVLAVTAISGLIAWVGYDSGRLYYTEDGGATWEERTFVGSGTGEVRVVRFFNNLVGFLSHDSASPVGTILRTLNGGFDWEVVTTSANAGLNALHLCGVNEFTTVGNASGGTAFVGRAVGCAV